MKTGPFQGPVFWLRALYLDQSIYGRVGEAEALLKRNHARKQYEQQDDKSEDTSDPTHYEVCFAWFRVTFDHPAVSEIPAERRIYNINDRQDYKEDNKDGHFYQLLYSIVRRKGRLCFKGG